MTSQSSSWLWLDKYLEEKRALPQDAEQFLAFVRNRGGSLAYKAAKRLLAKKAVKAIQHDLSRRDSPRLESIPLPSRSPYDCNALSPITSGSDSERDDSYSYYSNVYSSDDDDDGDQSGVPNIEDLLKWENNDLWEENHYLRKENSQLRQEIQELRRQAVVPGMLSPAERETARWLQEELPWWVKESTTKQRRKPVAVPIFAVRFTHRFVNASLAFGDEHGNAQENILKLYEQLFRGRVELSEIEPLVVKLPETCEDDFGIRSRNNRRLLALRMLQSSRLDECLKVPCYLKSHQDYERDPKFREWFDHGDDRTSGWSIRSREGKSKHRGVAVFNNADAAVKGLENLLQRALVQDLPNEHGISLVEAVLKLIKRRPVAPGCGDDDEETLTFVSVEDHRSRSNAARNGWRGPVPGGQSWGYGNGAHDYWDDYLSMEYKN